MNVEHFNSMSWDRIIPNTSACRPIEIIALAKARGYVIEARECIVAEMFGLDTRGFLYKAGQAECKRLDALIAQLS